MGFLNATCPLSKAEIDKAIVEVSIVGNFDFQHLMFYISRGFSGAASILMLALALSHLQCYVRPREQRQIIRIAFYPVVKAVLSCFSIYSYPDSIYFLPSQDLYEPCALAAIFFLFIEFAAPDLDTRDQYFNELELRRPGGGTFQRRRRIETVPGGSLRWYQVRIFVQSFQDRANYLSEQVRGTFFLLHHEHRHSRG